MTSLIRYFVLTVLLPVACFAAQDTIAWKPDYKLRWGDFQGAVNQVAPHIAITSTGINYSFTLHKNQTFSFLIHCVFYKKKSWTKTSLPYLLLHEQGHYDISEIFARRLRKDFKEYQLNPVTISADLENMWESMLRKKETMNRQYDRETNHGEHPAKQEFWLKKIADEITRLAAWANNK